MLVEKVDANGVHGSTEGRATDGARECARECAAARWKGIDGGFHGGFSGAIAGEELDPRSHGLPPSIEVFPMEGFSSKTH
jgi:hypothetical protein